MKLAVEILAAIGALCLTSSLGFILLALFVAARRETRDTQQRLEAMERHPAGERLPTNGCDDWTPPAVRYLGVVDETPFSARTICGHLIYGDSLGDLLTNEIYHANVCEQLNRRKAS